MTVESGSEVIREWKAGWPVVASSFLGAYLCIVFGYSFGFFVTHIEQELGWPRSWVTSGVTIVSVIGALVHPVAGVLVDRYGPRGVAIPCVIAYSGALMFLSTTGPSIESWWLRCAILGIAFGCINSFLWLAATVSRFRKARGMAIAVLQLGPATGMATLPIIAQYLIDGVGWRSAYVCLGAGGLVFVLPTVFFLLRPAPKRESQVEKGQARARPRRAFLGDARFWRLVAAAGLVTFGINGLSMNFVPLLMDMETPKASVLTAASLLGIGSILGRVICGYLLDRLPANLLGAAAFGFPVISCILLSAGYYSPAALAIAALLIGLSLGCEVDCLAFIAARLFGLIHYATAVGLLATAMSFGAGLGPLLGASIKDFFASYQWFLGIEMFVFILGAVLIASVGNVEHESSGPTARLPNGV